MDEIKQIRVLALSLLLASLVPMAAFAKAPAVESLVKQLERLERRAVGLEPSAPPCSPLGHSALCLVKPENEALPSHLVLIAPERLMVAARSALEQNELGRNSSSNITLDYAALPSRFAGGLLLAKRESSANQFYDIVSGSLLLVNESEYLFALIQETSLVVVTNVRSQASGKESRAQFIVIEGREPVNQAMEILRPAILRAPHATIMHTN